MSIKRINNILNSLFLFWIICITSVSAVENNTWLYQIKIEREESCLAVAIASHWLVTPWHCLQHPNSEQPISLQKISLSGNGEQNLTAIELITRQKRYAHLGELVGNDIALVRVKEKIPGYVRLADSRSIQLNNLTSYLNSNKQTKINKDKISKVSAREIYTKGITRKGDSGAPLIGTDGILIGIASWRSGRNCYGGFSVFARIDPHLKWIQQHVGSRELIY